MHMNFETSSSKLHFTKWCDLSRACAKVFKETAFGKIVFNRNDGAEYTDPSYANLICLSLIGRYGVPDFLYGNHENSIQDVVLIKFVLLQSLS